MSISIVFLGTGAAVPTAKRSLPAVLLQRGNEQLMFDCGEGVQRQMMVAKLSLHKKLGIYITHLHGDHLLGLPGLLQTMALMDRRKPVEVYGPAGLAYFLNCLKEALQFQLTFDVNIHEITDSSLVCDNVEYSVVAARSNHAMTSLVTGLAKSPDQAGFILKKRRLWVFPKVKPGVDSNMGSNLYFQTDARLRLEKLRTSLGKGGNSFTQVTQDRFRVFPVSLLRQIWWFMKPLLMMLWRRRRR